MFFDYMFYSAGKIAIYLKQLEIIKKFRGEAPDANWCADKVIATQR
jgi:hypothetical protein